MREANLLTDEEHRRLVTLAFSDDDRAVDRYRLHLAPHCFDRHLVGPMAIALPHRLRARDCRLFDDAQEVQRQI